MTKYFVNKNQQSGYGYNHEVHKSWCPYLPESHNLINLGDCYSDKEALRKAQTYFENADGCYYCCESIHKK